MGYYTDYNIKIIFHDSDKETVDKCYLELEERGILNGVTGAKWYDHDSFFLEMSKRYRDIVFELTGLGEEREDTWKKYYVNGQVKKNYAKIVFPEFDPVEFLQETQQMKCFEVLVSRYVREDQTLFISAPSEEDLKNKFNCIKDLVYNNFNLKWEKDTDVEPKFEIFSIDKVESSCNPTIDIPWEKLK